MKEKINKLYHPLIIKHNSQPTFFEKRADAEYMLEAYNPLCGDRFKLYFELENGLLTKISFYGFGCAVSKASTSVLVKHLNQQSVKKSLIITKEFLSLFEYDTETANVPVTEEFKPFQVAKDFPGRLKCATLAWDEIHNFLLEI